MPPDPISLLPVAGPLTGAELLVTVQDGDTRQFAVARLMPSPPPPAGSPSGAKITTGAPLTITPGVAFVPDYDSALYDTDGYWLGAAGILAAPADGIFRFSANAVFTGADVGTYIVMRMEGPGGEPVAESIIYPAAAPAAPRLSCSGDCSLTMGGSVTISFITDGTDCNLDPSLFSVSPVGSLGTSPPPPDVYVADGFPHPDGTILDTTSAETGQPWVSLQGTFVINTGIVEPDSAADADINVVEVAHSDYQYTLLMLPVDDGVNAAFPCMVFRVQDVSNYLLVQLNSLAGKVQLYKRVAGAYTLIDEGSAGITSGVEYEVIVTADGTDVTVEVDGTQYFPTATVVDFLTETLAGIRVGYGVGAPGTPPQWDGLLIQAIP